MKKLRRSRTFWAALILPVVGWIIQRGNSGEWGGMMPLEVQTWGPLGVSIGFILLRLTTGDCVVSAYDRCPLPRRKEADDAGVSS